MTEISLVLIKHDAVQRGLIGEVISRFERKGLQLVGLKMLHMTEELASRHYEEHQGKNFYEGLVEFITSGPIIAMAWKGNNAIAMIRKLLGATNPQDAAPGTIRGDYVLFISNNAVHASDSGDSAKRELNLFFSTEELFDYPQIAAKWIGY